MHIPIRSGPHPVPAYARPGDAGVDLRATEQVTLEPGGRALIGTGVRIALPDGYAALVVPRSGLAARIGLGIVNSPGLIDSGYRGEIKVAAVNHDRHRPIAVHVGDRIAQLVVIAVAPVVFTAVDVLPDSVRGEAGFGSTGTH